MRSLKAAVVVMAGFAVGVLPALGASKTVTDNGLEWSPKDTPLEAGDDVRWEWTGFHNVAFEDGTKSGSPQSGGSFEKTFTTPGTFRFRCEQHSTSFTSGMVGTVTVTQGGTTTTTTTGTGTTPTNTTMSPTDTPATDTTAPTISRLKRRAGRRALTLTYRSSEAGEASATVRRRNLGARRFRVIVRRTRAMSQGANTWTLQRAARGLRRGAYRVTLVFADEAGNETRTRTLIFKIA